MSVLRAAPYNLIYGQVPKVRISSFNVNGWSQPSVSGPIGATIRTEPITMTQPYRGG